MDRSMNRYAEGSHTPSRVGGFDLICFDFVIRFVSFRFDLIDWVLRSVGWSTLFGCFDRSSLFIELLYNGLISFDSIWFFCSIAISWHVSIVLVDLSSCWFACLVLLIGWSIRYVLLLCLLYCCDWFSDCFVCLFDWLVWFAWFDCVGALGDFIEFFLVLFDWLTILVWIMWLSWFACFESIWIWIRFGWWIDLWFGLMLNCFSLCLVWLGFGFVWLWI